MQKITRSFVLALLAGCFVVSTLNGQTSEFVDKYNKTFLKKDPKIGAELKEVSVFDEQGKPLKLGSTRGKYSVLIFGCLT